MNLLKLLVIITLIGGISVSMSAANAQQPVKMIFDTDMGNDIDDALALSVIHELANRGEVELLAVVTSKDNPWAAVYVDVINHFYGRPDIPIGVVRGGITPDDGNFIRAVSERKANGEYVYPRKLERGKDAPEAVELMRKTLAAQPDDSVVMVSVGFMTNFGRLLDSQPDDASPLDGTELVGRKVRLYVMMGGDFGPEQRSEYNVVGDPENTYKVFERWPSPLAVSGFEIGLAIRYPAVSIEQDFGFVENHPVAEGYRLYMQMPYDRPTWDLTAVLYGVRPDRGYFGISPKGKITFSRETGKTIFEETAEGKHQYLTVTPEQIIRTREALVWLTSAPPRN